MKISARLFFSFWSVTSATFLHLGFKALDRTGLSNSVSPVIMCFLKHFLAISTCHSSTYALIFRPDDINITVKRRYFWAMIGIVLFLSFSSTNHILVFGALLVHVFTKFCARLFYFDQEIASLTNAYSVIVTMMFFSILSFSWYFLVFTLLLIVVGEYSFRERILCVSINLAIESSMFLVSGKTKFFPALMVLIALFSSAYWANFFALKPFPSESFETLLPITVRGGNEETRFSRKFVKFAIGLGGTILFQNFFRLSTFDHVKAFLYLAVSWLANLTLVGVRGDLGVLNFVMGNVIVGCTVSQFGLGRTTWLAYSATLLLFGVRLRLLCLTFVKKKGHELRVVLWKDKKIAESSLQVYCIRFKSTWMRIFRTSRSR